MRTTWYVIVLNPLPWLLHILWGPVQNKNAGSQQWSIKQSPLLTAQPATHGRWRTSKGLSLCTWTHLVPCYRWVRESCWVTHWISSEAIQDHLGHVPEPSLSVPCLAHCLHCTTAKWRPSPAIQADFCSLQGREEAIPGRKDPGRWKDTRSHMSQRHAPNGPSEFIYKTQI